MEMETEKPIEDIKTDCLIQEYKTLLYNMWEGNNMFCCKGKLIAGPKHDLPAQICV